MFEAFEMLLFHLFLFFEIFATLESFASELLVFFEMFPSGLYLFSEILIFFEMYYDLFEMSLMPVKERRREK